MLNRSEGVIIITLFIAAFLVAGYGYISNIVDLIYATQIGGLELVRVIGIFAVPVGIIMGWVF